MFVSLVVAQPVGVMHQKHMNCTETYFCGLFVDARASVANACATVDCPDHQLLASPLTAALTYFRDKKNVT